MLVLNLINLLDVIHAEHQQSDTSFIFMSETDNLCGTATQSGDSPRVNIKFWHTKHHHSNKDSLATAAAARKENWKGRGRAYTKVHFLSKSFFSSHQHHKMSLKSWEDKINAWCLELFMTASVSVYMEWPNSLLHSLGPYFTLGGLAWCTAGTCGSPCHRKPSTFLPTLPRTPFHLSLGPSVPAPVMPQDNTAALPTAWCPSPASGHPRAVSVPHLCLFFFLLPFKNCPSCTGRLEPTGKQIISPAFISIQFILFTSSFAVSWIKR